MSTPIYEPLDIGRRQVRLFDISRAMDADGAIECSMESYSLDDKPTYFALSYVWGDPALTENIIVNSGTMPVTVNLAAFLRQLRANRTEVEGDGGQESPRLIWADAICINQADTAERNLQVGLMRDIYRQAQTVFSWLGPSSEDSDMAMELLRQIAREVAHLGPDDDRYEWMKQYPELTTNMAGKVKWASISHLLERDYWTRTWILQEIVLAQEISVMCGAQTLPWNSIKAVDSWTNSISSTDQRPSFVNAEAWSLIAGTRLFSSAPFIRSDMLRDVWLHPSATIAGDVLGLKVLEIGRDLNATDARDKVYGLLGLTDVPITPDYSKSVRDIYIETAACFLASHGLTRTLNSAGSAHEGSLSLPSWVPDWSTSKRKMATRTDLYTGEEASPKTPSFHIDRNTPSILHVPGVHFCHVKELEPDPPEDKKFPEAFKAWNLYRSLSREDGCRPYVTGIPPLQAVMRLVLNDEDILNGDAKLEIPSPAFFTLGNAFVMTLCAFSGNRELELEKRCLVNLAELGLATDQDYARTFSQQLLGQSTPVGPWESAIDAMWANVPAWLRIIQTLEPTFRSKQLFHTTNGYIGIGPAAMEPQDLVCILRDCVFPVVLRRKASQYVLVGTCMIQGLMDGEMHEGLDENPALQSFELC